MFDEQILLRRIYFFILAASVLILVIVALQEWRKIREENYLLLENRVRLNGVALHSDLDHLGVLLKITGRQLRRMLRAEQPDAAQKLLDSILEENPVLTGLVLVDDRGYILLGDRRLEPVISRRPVLQQNEMLKSLERAKGREELTLGYSHFSRLMQKWVIPVVQPVLEGQGGAHWFLLTAFPVDDATSVWNSKPRGKDVRYAIVKDDGYMQYLNNNVVFRELWRKAGRPDNPHPEFFMPYPMDFIEAAETRLKHQTGMSFEELQRSGQLVRLETRNLQGKPLLSAVQYDDKYRLFITAALHRNVLVGELMSKIKPHLLVFTLFNLVLLGLFKYLAGIQKRQRAELQRQARHDALTGLPNRAYLRDEFRNLAMHRGPFVLLFLDLDNFKDINDSHGHGVGDRILVRTSQRIRRTLRDGYQAMRHGGDEFIIICPAASLVDVTEFAADMADALRRPIRLGPLEFSITCSMGVVQYPDDGDNMDDLLRKADMAMYQAKRHKNRIMVFNNRLEQDIQRRIRVERALRMALQNGELHLVYQPQLDASSRTMLGMEALLRWDHPQLGRVSPAEFIPVAESVGLIEELTRFVMQQGIRDLAALPDSAAGCSLSINVSAQLLNSAALFEHLDEICREAGVERGRIVLENTESLFIENPERARLLLEGLRAKGYRISLDDFGTGYSSLSLLSTLPLDELKIDGSFVRNMLVDARARHLVASIINISRTLGLTSIAEGVETEAQAHELARMGCNRFQGYLFAQPMPWSELLRYQEESARQNLRNEL